MTVTPLELLDVLVPIMPKLVGQPLKYTWMSTGQEASAVVESVTSIGYRKYVIGLDNGWSINFDLIAWLGLDETDFLS